MNNLQVAVSAKMHKKIELILKEMGFIFKRFKVELISIPLRLKHIMVQELQKSSDKACYFKMNLDVAWNSPCDIKLKENHLIPKFRISNITFSGCMKFLFNPLSDAIPCIGGIQYGLWIHTKFISILQVLLPLNFLTLSPITLTRLSI